MEYKVQRAREKDRKRLLGYHAVPKEEGATPSRVQWIYDVTAQKPQLEGCLAINLRDQHDVLPRADADLEVEQDETYLHQSD